MKRTILLSLLLIQFYANGVADAGLDEGFEALKRGDYALVWKECHPLAEEGNPQAQAMVGMMYSFGVGVPKNYILALMWLNLAAVIGDEDIARLRDDVESKMAPGQIAEAQQLAREWKPKGK